MKRTMSMTALGMGLLAVMILTSAASANLVTNGDFEGEYYADPTYGSSVPEGWNWYPFPDANKGRIYKGVGLGVDDSNCVRLRLVQNLDAKSLIYQVVDTVPGQAYTLSAQWKLGNSKPDIGNPIIPWIGAFIINGGTPDDAGTNKALIDAVVPDPWRNHPNRAQWPYTPPEAPTELILPPDKEIVAEHAYHYGYDLDNALDYWETIYDAAGGAGEPTMPGIGESAANGGGAAWQTQVATGDHMIVGFFILDAPSTTGGGSDLYIDNVAVTPEPVTLALLALGLLHVARRRR